MATTGKGRRSSAGGGTPVKVARGAAIPGHAARSRIENILRQSLDGFMTLDASWRLTYLNESAARMLGKTAAKATGKQAWAEFAASAEGDLEKCCRRALAEQTAVEFETSFARDERCFAVKAYPIADEELAICFRDITTKHRAEEKAGALRRELETQVDDLRQLLEDISRARDAAEQAGRAKDDFLAALAHEMRTPLNPILLLATDAAENPKLREEVRQAFATIAKHVAQEARLIDTWMDQMRISHGNVVLDLRPLDLQDVLREAAEAVQADLDRKRVTLALDFVAGQHLIHGDAARLQQVFGNVLQNVLRLVEAGGRSASRPAFLAIREC